MSRARDLGDVGSKANFLDTVSTDLGDFSGQSIPHIIPGVLYPAVEGKDLAGVAFSGSYVYGTAHTDNRKYYYTDIKGSKPIKDPRIGGHFGSQRHKFKSLQLLEQETATHGKDVFSIDGREWIRAVESFQVVNNAQGNYILGVDDAQGFVEIVGYFSDANMLVASRNNTNRGFTTHIDGGAVGSERTNFETSADTPLGSRYVDRSSLSNLALNQTLGIHTLKITDNANTDQLEFYGIELIAQDTTSTANRSKIQIPSQNVVSYGKKFTVSGTPHYDPFSAKTDGSAWTSPTSGTNNANSSASWPTNIDTATSLGLDKWVDGSNYYRPYNGGRVVKWVDSSGTIKTSVTVIPPNAKSIKSADVNKKAKNAPNDTYLPTFEDETTDVNEDNLHEVAKTFHMREFGNGSANGNASYKDVSTIDDNPNTGAFVLDDGLTSFSFIDMGGWGGSYVRFASTGDYFYLTFIGTGITLTMPVDASTGSAQYDKWIDGVQIVDGDYSRTTGVTYTETLAQNLPYGTHVLKVEKTAGDVFNEHYEYTTFHQPKKPPIPEDACVIADYMLTADHVIRGAQGIDKISKGVRYIAPSRDIFYSGGSWTFTLDPSYQSGLMIYGTSSSTTLTRATSFSTNAIKLTHNALARYQSWYTNDTAHSSADATTKVGANESSFYYPTATTLGNNTYDTFNVTADGNSAHNHGFEVVSPIHTSFHYQPFETPFLHELIGGDRNMEQTNLVVSPDGQTWDEVTRDVSYLGKLGINTDAGANQNTLQNLLFTEWRGKIQGANFYNKGFAIGYDRVICLISGRYRFFYSTHADTDTSSGWSEIRVNGLETVAYYTVGSNYTNPIAECVLDLVRGDYVQVFGSAKADLDSQSIFNIQQV